MGNGSFYSCLIEPQCVSAWWKETARILVFLLSCSLLLNHLMNLSQAKPNSTHKYANRHCRVGFFTFARQPLSKQLYTKTVGRVEGALWLSSQTLNILCYLPPSSLGKTSVPVCIRDISKEIIQINFFGVYFSTYQNNYSSQCRRLAVDIYLTASRLSKYPPLATSTSVNS